MIVIQVRGTSGSGKSTVIRQVMERIGDWEPNYVPPRRKPLWYESNGISILGHYESPCGGCDTIGSARAVYDLIQELDVKTVICEGLLLSEDTKWSSRLSDLRVLFLNTPLDTCLDRIRKRREEVGNDKPLNPDNTSNRVRVIERARMKLVDAGVHCRRCSSRQAPRIILDWLGHE